MSARTRGILALVASAFGFALMAACVRLADDFGGAISCFQKSFFRNALAFTLAFAVLLRSPAPRAPLPRGGLGALLLRCTLGTIGIFANFYALSRITIAEGQALNKTAPFFTVVFAALFLRERVTWRQAGALALAFAGMILVAKPGFAGAAAFPLAMGLLGGAMAGGAYASVRRLGTLGVSGPLIVLVFSAFSCLASVPFICARFDPMTPAQVVILLGAGLGAAIGQFGVTAAYRFAAPREIAVWDYSNILFTALFGYALFGQIPDALSCLGFAAIVLAALWMRPRDRKTNDWRP